MAFVTVVTGNDFSLSRPSLLPLLCLRMAKVNTSLLIYFLQYMDKNQVQ